MDQSVLARLSPPPPSCAQVEVHCFGSLPLGTFLPDGDIDIIIVPRGGAVTDSALRANWATRLEESLQIEQRSQHRNGGQGHPRIKETHVIPAEVQVVKILVDGLKVDVVFAQHQGLGTLSFLEEMDRQVGRGHLLKRSILLTKAWAYYETRILGSHNYLLSTYALETLVLFVLNKWNGQLATPLDVFRKFLDYFGSFSWDDNALTLRGPVPRDLMYSGLAPPPPEEEEPGSLLAMSEVRRGQGREGRDACHTHCALKQPDSLWRDAWPCQPLLDDVALVSLWSPFASPFVSRPRLPPLRCRSVRRSTGTGTTTTSGPSRSSS